jgi:hypothetical protein
MLLHSKGLASLGPTFLPFLSSQAYAAGGGRGADNNTEGSTRSYAGGERRSHDHGRGEGDGGSYAIGEGGGGTDMPRRTAPPPAADSILNQGTANPSAAQLRGVVPHPASGSVFVHTKADPSLAQLAQITGMVQPEAASVVSHGKADPSLAQLAGVVVQQAAAVGAGGGLAGRQEAVYSARVLAGFCLVLNEEWRGEGEGGGEVGEAGAGLPGLPPVFSRQLVLNARGACNSCNRLPHALGQVGVVSVPLPPFQHSPATASLQHSEAGTRGQLGKGGGHGHGGGDDAERFECTVDRGRCGVVDARWPAGDEPGLPEWFARNESRRP